MPTVRYQDTTVSLGEGETVLDGLLRAGIDAAHSCRSGCCHSCMLRSSSGVPPPVSQETLKDSLRAKGYFLACIAHPDEDLVVASPADDDVSVKARIVEITILDGGVARVLIQPQGSFDYKPGQFVNLVRGDGLIRSYSTASLPRRDEHIELHVRRIPGGRMSNWLYDGSARGEAVELRGPAGDCFYLGNSDEDLLLIGTGTGLAPLWGIVHDAIDRGHRGRLILYHGGRTEEGLYMVQELRELAARHPALSYRPCVLEGSASEGIEVGAIDRIVLDRHKDLGNWRIYLCGDPGLVFALRKKLFIQGASLKRIHADAFVLASQ
jgi:NAD(P)H-flavin reductase